MKHYLVLISVFILITFISCKDESKQFNTGKAIVAGQIVDETSLAEVNLISSLREFAGDSKTFPDQNGYFKFNLQLPSEFEFSFWYKNTSSKLLIGPGDSLFIKINPEINTPIIFSGTKSSFLNKMLVFNNSINLLVPTYEDLMKRYQNGTPEQFLHYRRDLFNDNMTSLKNTINEINIPNDLELYYESRNRVIYGYDLLRFLAMYSKFQGVQLTKENIPKNYWNTIDSLYFASLNDYWVRDYYNFIITYSNILVTQLGDTLLNAILKRDKLLASKITMDDCLKKFSGFQKDYLVSFYLNNLINNSFINNETFEKYHSTLSIEFFRSFLAKKYSEYNLIQNAKLDTSKIHLFDISVSDTISLFNTIQNNHIGKTLYIDIWGTYCGPCISSFAYMPQLKKSLSDENIDYIYLAISSRKNQWEKIIKNNKLEGFHYLLNDRQKEELYGIIDGSGIPHYFIINQNGNIMIRDAKAPTDPLVIKQLKDISMNKD